MPTTPTGAKAQAGAYPPHWEADVVVADGGTVHLRPITPGDADRLVAFHSRLSDRTRYLRFFGPYPTMPARDIERFTEVDHYDRVALVAVLGDDIIAVSRYERLASAGTTAEVAFVVEDAHQGRGLGSVLLEHLAAAARERGVERFVADVLAENHQMVRVFRDAGYEVSRSFEEGVLRLEFANDPTEESMAVAFAREQAAEARSVHNLLHPASVAVVGASIAPEKVGHEVLRNLLVADFSGPVYPVNADHRAVRGVRAYSSVLEIPDDVDLAVIAVPAANVDEVFDQCLAKGVRGLIVVTSGFGEAGPAGASAERTLVTQARAHGMRVVGPNALGAVNTDPAVRLNATLAPRLPGRGRTGFFCQSGALGVAILAAAAERGLGLSTFVSAGNRADVSGNDLLQYWQTDPATDVVLLYLESFGNPRKFARLARRLARQKPIVAVRSGRHGAGLPKGLAATSVEIDEASERALFEASGVIQVESVAQLFDTALLLAHQPLPADDRVAIVGNSTALGVLAADTVLAQGLRLAGEPIDVGAAATPDELADAVSAAAHQDDVGALIAVFVPPIATPGAAYARALREAMSTSDIPVVSTFLAAEGVPAELAVEGPDGFPAEGSVPSYPSPERAALALARVVRYAQWRSRPVGQFVRPAGIRHDAATDLMSRWLPDDSPPSTDPAQLTDEQVLELLGCYGIDVVAFRTVHDVDTAVAAAAEVGYPVALKSTASHLRHRNDLVGVQLDLASAAAVRNAYDDLSTLGGNEVYVQRMAPKGISCAIGVQDDPSFGSVVSFGLAGVVSDLVGDRSYRSIPLSDQDAAELIRAPKAAPLLTGYQGSAPVDVAALEDIVLRVAALVEDQPWLRTLRLEPVLASAGGAAVAGAWIQVGAPPRRADPGPRRLR